MRRAVCSALRRWSAKIRPRILQPSDVNLYSSVEGNSAGPFDFPASGTVDPVYRLNSCLVTAEALRSDAFRYWCSQLHEPWCYHRKLWEYGYICQALYERGMLAHGKRGLGFAVGREPLPALFARFGCDVLATDLGAGDERTRSWAQTNQWADGTDRLNDRGICHAGDFKRRVTFRPVDMNSIPDDLREFDFTWSSCSFEHCGSLELGMRFMQQQMACLRPGGIAVHTTEFNLSSNSTTAKTGDTVIFRRRDVEAIVRQLRADGHTVEPLNLSLGSDRVNRVIDLPPYRQEPHLRLRLGWWVTTSIGVIAQCG